ncbi:hypothetical protein BC936DRAFT_136764 [Jimgerdemannia flammicorona]|uniref:RecA family profile 1 domain-containing protein n=1 Tax=Jimgerdemannia flammicorona TaxID=994334 RepID=A0A433CYV4_9FUNG|nr:hypothetical protein BC936DRAFT_136764 [Jimgerdemannia flammicorona]
MTSIKLCFTVQLPLSEGGLDGGVAYLYSEGKFPLTRLNQLAASFQRRHPALRAIDPFFRIHFVNIADAETQRHVIIYHLPALLGRARDAGSPIRLVVVDSIAALYRAEQLDRFSNSEGRREQKRDLCELGEHLKATSDRFGVPVVCANQVSDTFAGKDDNGREDDHPFARWLDVVVDTVAGAGMTLFAESLSKKPALGLTWSNTVNVRIRLARSPRSEFLLSRRLLCIEFAPHVRRAGCEVFVDKDGVHSREWVKSRLQ